MVLFRKRTYLRIVPKDNNEERTELLRTCQNSYKLHVLHARVNLIKCWQKNKGVKKSQFES